MAVLLPEPPKSWDYRPASLYPAQSIVVVIIINSLARVYVCLCICVSLCGSTYVCIWRQWLASDALLACSLLHVLRSFACTQSFLIWLFSLATLLWGSPSLVRESWGISKLPLLPGIYVGARGLNSDPHALE